MEGRFRFEEPEKRDRKMHKEERWEKIRKAKYSRQGVDRENKDR